VRQSSKHLTASVPTVSVVVRCYSEERWADLEECLESLFVQTRSADEIVVVVDHNPAMLERVQQTWAGWVKAYANTHARGSAGGWNTSLDVTTSDIVAFIDDDAVATPSWLEHLLRHYESPRVIGVGGFITPQWLAKQPRWYPEEFFWIVGGSYKGLPEKLSPIRNLWGGNMSFRRALMINAGGFLEMPELGNVGSTPVGGDETELCIRLRQHNRAGVILFDPKARVYHKVPAHKATFGYFLSRCRFEGRSKAVIRKLVGRDGLSSETNHLKKTLPLGVLKALGKFNLAKACAIIAGTFMAGVGFLGGRRSAQNVTRQPAPLQSQAPGQSFPESN
jgi:cellulose synthase/poly-beta-1,6-N-acetylglucosamine synthase-like glycosyltransferase